MSGDEYRVCGKCGARFICLSSPATAAKYDGYCRRCDGPPKGAGKTFQANVMRNEEGTYWYVEVIDELGEVVLRQDCPNRDSARALCHSLATGIAGYLKALGMLA